MVSQEDLILKNASIEARFVRYGASLQSLVVHDKEGNKVDVVLGHDTEAEYRAQRDCFGSICGRIAGRLSSDQFQIADQIFTVARNEGNNHLHGGNMGFDTRDWYGEMGVRDGEPCVIMSYHSPDGEEGYPGNLDVKVIYSLTEQNGLLIEYVATTDEATPLCLTNHAYFNLDGIGDISGMTLQIDSKEITEVTDDMSPTGRRVVVDGLPDDLQTGKRIVDFLDDLHRRHGAMYFTGNTAFSKSAELKSENGIRMEVWTDQACLQFYSGAHLNVAKGKGGKPYEKFAGLCLECQGYPNAPLFPHIQDITLKPGEVYRQKTEYRFSL